LSSSGSRWTRSSNISSLCQRERRTTVLRRFLKYSGFCSALLAFSCGVTASLHADAFDYSNLFSNYGTVTNVGVCGGICAAAEMINSFIYLDNQYPNIYHGMLIPGNDPNRAAQWFSTAGWTAPDGQHYDGYYSRKGNADTDLLQTKKDWVNSWAPGTSFFDYMIGPLYPTVDFLANQIRDHEDVELVVDLAGDGAHLIALTAISCDAKGNCKMRFQDPNDPTHEQMANLFKGGSHPNELGFYYPSFGRNAFIRDALAESPFLPEPSSWILMGGGLLAVVGRGWRQRFRGR
jgi:hypothetical protein